MHRASHLPEGKSLFPDHALLPLAEDSLAGQVGTPPFSPRLPAPALRSQSEASVVLDRLAVSSNTEPAFSAPPCDTGVGMSLRLVPCAENTEGRKLDACILTWTINLDGGRDG
eukprot:scaffold233477_cov51-Prasinocladus_malaysianus.AAC.1